MKHKNIKIVSIDTENMLYTCDDGKEYPLMDELETLSIEELQKHLYSVKQTMLDIIEKTENKILLSQDRKTRVILTYSHVL